jgi:formate dehydrogenase
MQTKTIPIQPENKSERRERAKPKGRPVDPAALAEVRGLLGDEPRRADLLIEHLHRIQDAFGHLSARHLAALAAEMRLAQAEVFEVATFYHHFDVVRESEEAPPKLTIRVCESLSCEMAGARDLLQKLPALLGSDVRVLPAPCVGRCEQAPVAVIGQNPVAHATIDGVAALAAAGRTTCDIAAYADYAAYRNQGGYRLYADCIAGATDRESVIKALEDSSLRGLGGAGFPAGRKWRIVAAEPAPRLMAVNIDEGEPGTFKDRYYLERDPHRFLEGMLIAAWAVGIAGIYVYLRDEYAGCRDILEKGAAWFAGHGRNGRKGLRSFSVSGRVKKPGVHLAPAGITVNELIAEFCGGMQDGHEFYGYLPGGASGGILPASMGDIPLDFDTLQPYGCFIGSAAVIILSNHDRARDAAQNMMEFFADESCGQCTPCRVGTQKASGLMREARWDKPLLADLSQAMVDASICGLGQAAPNPIACVVKYFPQEIE